MQTCTIIQKLMIQMNYISLFSGIGGFEVGIQKSKHKDNLNCIGYSEVDEVAESIYNRWFPNHKRLGDVREIRTEELPKFDFLFGGFPCQSFSNSGNKQGFDDTRGTLFFEIARILQDCKPTYFLLENVEGLLWNKGGKTFQRILGVLANLGYDIQYEVLDSRSFGVPQRRRRVYIKGYFRERCGLQVHPIPRYPRQTDLSLNEDYLKIKTDTQKGFKGARVGDGVRISRLNQKNGGRGRVQYGSVGTLMCGCNWGVVTDDLLIRSLTPMEYENLQGFDPNWTQYGKDGELISDSQRYKCVGNAVTTNVVTYIMDNWELIDDGLV